MGKALYRKYRSKNLSEIIGQEHITDTLSNALKQGNISHAYLFTGPRGVGKTSIARILAHEVNGLAYDEHANHLDIIEIDAASNRRIDEIRELRERVHTAPANAKFKVYIIDEVHMLTKEAFNALLKTLEEPPAHAIFILATTEAHKLPETIVSRTQRFTFRPIDHAKAVEHLRTIAQKENIEISDSALALIAEHGGGSFRDSISLLDQANAAGKKIKESDVQAMLGIAPDEVIAELLAALEHGTLPELVSQLRAMREQGLNPARVAKQLSGLIKQRLLDGALGFDAQATGKILNDLLYVSASHDPESSLEIVLMTVVLDHRPVVISEKDAKDGTAPKAVQQATESPKNPVAKLEIKENKEAIQEKAQEREIATPMKQAALDNEIWDQVLEAIKKKHNTLYGVARMARATISGEEITLCFKFAFHQKRINEAKNKQVLTDIIENLTGRPVKISCIVDKGMDQVEPSSRTKASPRKTSESSAAVDNISNIFGSAEVIE